MACFFTTYPYPFEAVGPPLDSPQRMFYLIFDHDQNLRFRMPVSSGYLLFVLGEKEKCL